MVCYDEDYKPIMDNLNREVYKEFMNRLCSLTNPLFFERVDNLIRDAQDNNVLGGTIFRSLRLIERTKLSELDDAIRINYLDIFLDKIKPLRNLVEDIRKYLGGEEFTIWGYIDSLNCVNSFIADGQTYFIDKRNSLQNYYISRGLKYLLNASPCDW